MGKLQRLGGVIPALITPFGADEQLDEARLRAIVQELLAEGVDGLYLTGSTGECFLMTAGERSRVIEIVVEEVRGRIPLIAHVGDIGTRKSIALAREAERLGVDAISSVPPFYWQFTEEELYGYYAALAESTALPLVVYNIKLAGLMGLPLLERLAGLPNVQGVKFTATTHHEINLLKDAAGPEFRIYSGCDEMGLSGLLFGADGLIGSFYNLMPEVYLQLCHAVRSGDLATAARLQRDADRIIGLALRQNYVSVIKIAMGWKGTDGGYCRAPFRNCVEREQELKDQFRALRDRCGITGVKFLEDL